MDGWTSKLSVFVVVMVSSQIGISAFKHARIGVCLGPVRPQETSINSSRLEGDTSYIIMYFSGMKMTVAEENSVLIVGLSEPTDPARGC